jgi:hypothetical protein
LEADLSPGKTFRVTDPDNSSDLRIRITAIRGVLSVADTSGISFLSPTTGHRLVIKGSATDLQNAINSSRYRPLVSGGESLSIEISNDAGKSWHSFEYRNEGTLAVNPATGNYYQFISATGITWAQAKAEAEQRTLNGQRGYLATITSQAENDFIKAQISGDGWIGASDETTEGTWVWATGPEAGQQFWNGNGSGSPVNGMYNNWDTTTSEPNDAGGEDYAYMINANGKWNDYPTASMSSIKGYIVEYNAPPNGSLIAFETEASIWERRYQQFNESVKRITSVDNSEYSNIVVGGSRRDRIAAGWAGDTITGGGNRDFFIYTTFLDSQPTEHLRDTITDFNSRRGRQGDRIDLRQIDANILRNGNQRFRYIRDSEFTSIAGQLRFDSSTGFLDGDINGDSVADFSVHLQGVTRLRDSSIIL